MYYFIFLQENPSEEDAAIVDKVLSLRLTKKEVCLFHLFNSKTSFFNHLNLILRILKTCSCLQGVSGPVHHG